MSTVLDIVKNPYRIFAHFARKYDMSFIPDKTYLKWMYHAAQGYSLKLKNPKTFTEKLQWMKLYDRKPVYTTMVDKYAAKEWAGKIIGEEHIIPTLGVWEHFGEINFEGLPEQFVLKCTHDSSSVIICKDKSIFDIKNARDKIEKALKKNFYYNSREWPYKNVPPRIIAEQYMIDNEVGELRDYKFFCFNGVPKIMYIATGRGSGDTYGDFFDMEFNHLDLRMDHDTASITPMKPLLFEVMQEAAKKLSEGIPQVRADFYEVNGQFYFGEMTFFHCGGFVNCKPDKWNKILGDWIKLF